MPTLWFCIIAAFWLGYLFLEGFDFGVGMLLPVLARDDPERRVMVNTIGPVWDGNEVWLIVAAGSMFAAFPAWYAGLFAAFYLPLLVVLLALIGRGVSFDYRGKVDSARWRNTWDRVIMLGSWLPALGVGALLGTNIGGIPLDANGDRIGPWWQVFGWHSLLGALGIAGFALVHGAAFIAVKTEGDVRARARKFVLRYGLVLLLPLGLLLATVADAGWAWAVFGVVVLAALLVPLRIARGREGQAFALLGVVIVAAVTVLFGSLYPNVLVSTVDGVPPLTVAEAASGDYTLQVVTWLAALGAPAVLAYQGWTYWVFRRRIGTAQIPKAHA